MSSYKINSSKKYIGIHESLNFTSIYKCLQKWVGDLLSFEKAYVHFLCQFQGGLKNIINYYEMLCILITTCNPRNLEL